MAAPLDRQHSNTLTRTLTQDSSNPSDFLLLTSTRASTLPAYSLPRPRFLPVLVGAAVLDLAWTISQGALLAREGKTGGLWVAVAVSLMRPLCVLGVAMSLRVRERSVWILGQLMLSFLVLLYHINELVQYSGPSAPTPPPKDSPAPPAVPSSLLISSPSPSFLADPRERGFATNLSRTTTWYITSFGFAVLHYLLYAIFVGIRRKRNPFIGRRGASVGGRRASVWGEQQWEGSEQRVPAPGLEGEEHLAEQGLGSGEDEFGDSDEEEDEFDESSEDDDDIVDIPRPSLRSRKSTASFFVNEEAEGSSRPRGAASALLPRSGSQYGTITSLAGI